MTGLPAGRSGPAVTARQPVAAAGGIAVLLLAAAITVAACSTGTKPGTSARTSAKVTPERIIAAPRALLSVSSPLTNGSMWAVAGTGSVGLFKFDAGSGQQAGSVSVSQAARSVAVTRSGVIGIALGTRSSGALELLHGTARKAARTVSLPAPAVQVVSAGTGTDFYVLTAWPGSASISVISSVTGKITDTLPAPKDAVSLAAAPQSGLVYVLQRNGLVDDIATHGGSIESSFSVSSAGEAIAVSPDGSTLYVLKGTSAVSNIAVVDAATGGITKVLPAPSHCVGLAVSPTGRQLYEAVGTPSYGNIQVFGS